MNWQESITEANTKSLERQRAQEIQCYLDQQRQQRIQTQRQRVFSLMRSSERPRYHFGTQDSTACYQHRAQAINQNVLANEFRQQLMDLGKNLLNNNIYLAHLKMVDLEAKLPHLSPQDQTKLLPFLAKFKRAFYNKDTTLDYNYTLDKDFAFAYGEFLYAFYDNNTLSDHIQDLRKEHPQLAVEFETYQLSRGYLSGISKPSYKDLKFWKKTQVSEIKENLVIAQTIQLQQQGRIDAALEHGKEYLDKHGDLRHALVTEQKRLAQIKEQQAQAEQKRLLQEQEKMRQAEQQALEKQKLDSLTQPLENAHEEYSLKKEEFKQQLIEEGKIVCDSNGRIISCDTDVLHQYNRYQLKGYRELLEEIPGFDQAIKDIQYRLKTDAEFKKAMQNLQGFTRAGFERQIKLWGAQVEILNEYKNNQQYQLPPEAKKAMLQELVEGYKTQAIQRAFEQEIPKMQEMHADLGKLIQRDLATPEQVKMYKALDEVLNGEIVWQTKQFDLSLDTHQMLLELGIESDIYEVCFGNQVQQEVHEILIKDINKWSVFVHAVVKDGGNIWSTMFGELNSLGVMANHLARSTDAMTFADCGHVLLDIAQDYGQRLSSTGNPLGTIISVDENILKAFVEASECLQTGDYKPFADGVKRLGWHSLVKPLKGVYDILKGGMETIQEISDNDKVSTELMMVQIAKKFAERRGREVSPRLEKKFALLQERQQEIEQKYQQRREALGQAISQTMQYLADAPTRELIPDIVEFAADVAIAELTFQAFGKGASKIMEEAKVTARPSRQAIEAAQKSIEAERPLFATHEGPAFEMPALVEEEAATSLAKGGQTVTGSSKTVNLVKPGTGKTLKEFNSKLLKTCDRHIFSDYHKKNGIMKLGKSEEVIKNAFVEKILEANSLGQLMEGDNTIMTFINGHKTFIKCHILNGEALSFDGYLLTSKTPRILGNFIRL